MSQQDQIKLAKDGNPFQNPEAAEKFIKDNELNPEIWGVMKHNGGHAVATYRHISELQEAAAVEAAKPKTSRVAETYSRVEFSAKGSENDLPYVPLSKNGKQLRIQRSKQVVLPNSYLEIADNASHPQWEPSDKPDQPMKKTGTIQRYQYRVIGKATRKEFLEMLAEGNEITNQAVERIQNQASAA